MRRRWVAAGGLVAVVAVVWVVVAVTGGSSDDGPGDRPVHLIEARPGDITSVEVSGTALTTTQLEAVRDDLAPLLAIRTFPTAEASYGLAAPDVVVATVHTRRRTYELRIGAYNFDHTAVYAQVDAVVATILPSLAEHLAADAGRTVAAQR